MSKRIQFIDIAKGLGIILVVWFHFPYLDKMLNFSKWGGWVTTFYMPLFFLLSGVFFKPTALSKKIKRLLVPYIGFYLLAFVLYLIKTPLKHEVIDWLRFFKPFCGAVAGYENTPIWFLLSLAQITALFYLIAAKVKNNLVGLLISFIISFIGYIIGLKVSLPYYIDVSMLCLFFFALGYYCKDLILAINIKVGFLLGFISVILYMLFPGFTNVSGNEIPMGYIPFSIISVCASLFIVAVSKAIGGTYISNILSWFGENSLIIMCTHVPLLMIPVFILKQVSNIYLGHFVGLLVLLLVEVFVVRFINKYAGFLIGK